MAAYELVTGQRIWELNLAGISTPAIAGEWIFTLTDDARLLAIARATGKVRWLVLASPHPLASSLALTPSAAANHPALSSPGPRPQRSQDALLRLLRALPRRRQRAAHHQRARQVRVRGLRAGLRHDLRLRLAPRAL